MASRLLSVGSHELLRKDAKRRSIQYLGRYVACLLNVHSGRLLGQSKVQGRECFTYLCVKVKPEFSAFTKSLWVNVSMGSDFIRHNTMRQSQEISEGKDIKR